MKLPKIYKVKSITHDTEDIFTITFVRPNGEDVPEFLPGQFNMLYRYGFGEVAISISGDPANRKELVHTIRAVGSVTKSLQQITVGEGVTARGPFGNHWPIEKRGMDVIVIAGGLGLPPLCSGLYSFTKEPNLCRKITLLYGARTPKDLIYEGHRDTWQESGVMIDMTVDRGEEGWKGNVQVVTELIDRNVTDPKKTLALMCGPEIMFKYAIQELLKNRVDENNIYLSMERNMKCGVGFCGHCQMGPYFVCKNGPVFSYPEVKKWLTIKEL